MSGVAAANIVADMVRLVRVCAVWGSLLLPAVPLMAGCGEKRDSAAGQPLSCADAIARIDAICRESVAAVARVGPEPQLRSGSRAELERYARWSRRVEAEVEAALRRIERVPVPDDARKGEVRSYVYFSRQAIRAGRALLRAAQTGEQVDADRLAQESESNSDQASFAARRYGLKQCGG